MLLLFLPSYTHFPFEIRTFERCFFFPPLSLASLADVTFEFEVEDDTQDLVVTATPSR